MTPVKKIIHIDMDCFFAAVEVRDNPQLATQPVAVGGSSDRRGVIATANYNARKFGVRSAMPTKRALHLCPHLVVVPSNFAKYKVESRKVREIFSRYTDLVEAVSLDEAYLDVTDSPFHNGIATLIAKEIRQKIWEETQLTASAGIAPNKFLAKIASEWRKPNGQYTVAPEMIAEFVKSLPVQKIHGVGKVTAHKLNSLGIHTCEDIQNYDTLALIRHFGKWGPVLKNLSHGIDHRRVRTDRVRKSLAAEITFSKDLATEDDILDGFKKVYSRFVERLDASRTPDAAIRNYSIKIKYFDFDLKTSDRRILGRKPTEKQFIELLLSLWKSNPLPLRLIGVGVGLGEVTPQMSLLE